MDLSRPLDKLLGDLWERKQRLLAELRELVEAESPKVDAISYEISQHEDSEDLTEDEWSELYSQLRQARLEFARRQIENLLLLRHKWNRWCWDALALYCQSRQQNKLQEWEFATSISFSADDIPPWSLLGGFHFPGRVFEESSVVFSRQSASGDPTVFHGELVVTTRRPPYDTTEVRRLVIRNAIFIRNLVLTNIHFSGMMHIEKFVLLGKLVSKDCRFAKLCALQDVECKAIDVRDCLMDGSLHLKGIRPLLYEYKRDHEADCMVSISIMTSDIRYKRISCDKRVSSSS